MLTIKNKEKTMKSKILFAYMIELRSWQMVVVIARKPFHYATITSTGTTAWK